VSEIHANGTVDNGVLRIHHRKDFDAALVGIKGDVRVTVEKWRATRSHPQNAYYWGVVVKMLSEYTGFETREMHEVLKLKFNPVFRPIVDKTSGEVKSELTIPGTTRRMKKDEFSDYCERIKRWAAQDLNVYIPDPNEETP
jgi:hypothetical protein